MKNKNKNKYENVVYIERTHYVQVNSKRCRETSCHINAGYCRHSKVPAKEEMRWIKEKLKRTKAKTRSKNIK